MRKVRDREVTTRQFMGILAISGVSAPVVVGAAALAFSMALQALPLWLG